MTSKTKKAPIPDATKITAQQQQQNDLNAANNRKFNNVNIEGPTGSSTWITNPDGTMTQRVGVNADQQAAISNQQGVAADLSGLARNMISNVDTGAFGIPGGLPTRTTGLDTSQMKNLNSTDYAAAREGYSRDMFARTMGLLQPGMDQQNKDAEQFLSDRGIPTYDDGTGAASNYRNNIARQQFSQKEDAARMAVEQGAQEQSRLFGLDQNTNENILRNQTADAGFRDNARDKGIEEAYQSYNAPLDRIRALFGSSPELQTMGPQGFNGASSAGGDIAGNTWNQYNAQNEQNKQAAAEKNAMINSIAGIAGTAGKLYMMSDENMKEDIAPADSILDRVEDIPISSWRYKEEAGQDNGERHVGPMAQDFKKSFGLGNGKTIPVVDAFGINIAAVQQLAKKVRGLEARVK